MLFNSVDAGQAPGGGGMATKLKTSSSFDIVAVFGDNVVGFGDNVVVFGDIVAGVDGA